MALAAHGAVEALRGRPVGQRGRRGRPRQSAGSPDRGHSRRRSATSPAARPRRSRTGKATAIQATPSAITTPTTKVRAGEKCRQEHDHESEHGLADNIPRADTHRGSAPRGPARGSRRMTARPRATAHSARAASAMCGSGSSIVYRSRSGRRPYRTKRTTTISRMISRPRNRVPSSSASWRRQSIGIRCHAPSGIRVDRLTRNETDSTLERQPTDRLLDWT